MTAMDGKIEVMEIKIGGIIDTKMTAIDGKIKKKFWKMGLLFTGARLVRIIYLFMNHTSIQC